MWKKKVGRYLIEKYIRNTTSKDDGEIPTFQFIQLSEAEGGEGEGRGSEKEEGEGAPRRGREGKGSRRREHRYWQDMIRWIPCHSRCKWNTRKSFFYNPRRSWNSEEPPSKMFSASNTYNISSSPSGWSYRCVLGTLALRKFLSDKFLKPWIHRSLTQPSFRAVFPYI